MRRRDFTLGLGALALAGCATRPAARADDLLVFAYFTTGKGATNSCRTHWFVNFVSTRNKHNRLTSEVMTLTHLT
mgnify:CR=1 FL=1